MVLGDWQTVFANLANVWPEKQIVTEGMGHGCGSLVFAPSVPELAIIALICLPIVLLIGVILKKMGYSDLTAICLALLMLTPLNWLVLAYLVFFKWPIHDELELLRRQVDEKATPRGIGSSVREGQSNPLHVAIRKGYSDVVEALISQGVDVDAIAPKLSPSLSVLLPSSPVTGNSAK